IEMIGALGLDSATALNWLDHYDLAADTFPRASYAKAASANFQFWDQESKKWPVPYVPNITVGFDATPHCCATDKFERRAYPYLAAAGGEQPAGGRGAVGERTRSFFQP